MTDGIIGKCLVKGSKMYMKMVQPQMPFCQMLAFTVWEIILLFCSSVYMLLRNCILLDAYDGDGAHFAENNMLNFGFEIYIFSLFGMTYLLRQRIGEDH